MKKCRKKGRKSGGSEKGEGPASKQMPIHLHGELEDLPSLNSVARVLRIPRPLQESLGPFVPKVSWGGVPDTGVSEGVSHGVSPGPALFGARLRSVQAVSRECPRSVKKVSRTLWGHSRDTLWTLRSPRHPMAHSLEHPRFFGTPSLTLPGTLPSLSLFFGGFPLYFLSVFFLLCQGF